MTRIFISYRRADSKWAAARIFDFLVNHFGRDQVFMDIDTIDPGKDFVQVLEESVIACDALVAVIGNEWLNITNEHGQRRLDNPNDYVRFEIATALTRDTQVIPVLIDGASMPRQEELPEDLAALARRNALEVSETRFQHDVERLAATLDNLKSRGLGIRPAWIGGATAIVLGLAGLMGILSLAGVFGSPQSGGDATGSEAEAESEDAAPAEAEPVREITFYTWAEYMPDDLYEKFEQETGITVTESPYTTNNEMLIEMGAGREFDLVLAGDSSVILLIQQEALAELEHANIPNLSNLRDSMRTLRYDPSNRHCVPYLWGTTGIGYDASVMDAPQSWSVFFEPDPGALWYGRAVMLDDPRDSFGAALRYLGYDINTTDEAQLEEAKTALIRAQAGLLDYVSEDLADRLASGEIVMAHAWNTDASAARFKNQSIAYVVPSEGGTIWVDNLCIPASVSPERKEAAEAFINFLLDPENGARLASWNYAASPNAAAEELLNGILLEDPIVYPPSDVLGRSQFVEPLGEFEWIYQSAWDDVKAQY